MPSHRSPAPRRPLQGLALPVLLLSSFTAAASAGRGDEGDAATEPGSAERVVDFEREIRPILADNCFACHGPDVQTRAAELRLDTKEGLFGDRGGYATVVPGDPERSELWLRITDPVDAMPPADFGKTLDERERELLRTWIEQGARWSGHWAFEPVERPEPPAVSDPQWVANPIDAFVLAGLDAAGLAPSEPADRASLLRRVTFDLTGLPPTPEELDAFLADDAPDAYEKVVDRLLASPHYGERQTQVWLDLARYADSDGDGKDGPRDMWKWRDWVIDAFNENVPYDRFVVEQLAGDLLPEPTLDQRIATGFNRNHFIYTKFGAEKDEYRTAYVVDRVNTTSTVFLGLTMGCAQCHDHKYDPISQEDYYRVFAFFNNVPESDVGSSFGNSRPRLVVGEGEAQARYEAVQARIEELEAYFEGDDADLDAAQAAWEQERLAALEPIEWKVLEPVGLLSQNGALLERRDDGSILATGPNPSTDVYHLVARPGAGRVVAFKVEALPDPSFAEGRSGRSMDGTFSLSELEVRVRSILEGDDGLRLEFVAGEASVRDSQGDGAVDGSERGGWSVPKEFAAEPQSGVFLLEEPLELKDADVVRLTVQQESQRMYNMTLGRFRVLYTGDERVLHRRLPLRPGVWRAVGPFGATSVENAFATVQAPEERIGGEEGIDFDEKFDPIDVKELAKAEREAEKAAQKAAEEAAQAAAAATAGPPRGAAEDGGTAPAGETVERSAARAGRTPAVPLERTGSAVAPSVPLARVLVAPASGNGLALALELAAAQAAQAARDLRAGAEPAPRAAVDAPPGTPSEPVVARAEAGGRAAPPAPEPEAAADDGPAAGGSGQRRGRGGDDGEKLVWEEKRDWRLDGSVRLSGRYSAWYLHRTFAPEVPRDVALRFSGLEGLKLWVDGELLFERAPDPAEAKEEGEDGREEDGGEDDAGGFFRPGELPEYELFEFRLEPGEHEVVVKAVTGRTGARATLQFQALGRDVVPYEVECSILSAEQDLALIAAESGAAEDDGAEDEEVRSDYGFGDEGEGGSTAERRRLWVREWFRRHVSEEGRPLYEELQALRRERSALERKLPSVMVMEERDEPRETYVLMRGDYKAKGQRVEPGVPTVLPPLPDDAPGDRLGLARWIVAPENPLTARVAVNRLWQQHFGRAIVTTPGDFGVRGALPSHPELLDWLASEFVASGWDVKAMHRLVVTSSTYRQSSRITPEHLERDPDNVWLARAPRGRLSAEAIRDNALAVSGLLVTEIGGESVKPYQPKGLWRAQSMFQSYKADEGDALYRRGIYVYWKRATLYPSFEAFDAPARLTCTVDRPLTTTPLQSLVLLNDPVYVEAARFLGQRMLEEGGASVTSRLAYGFRLCTSRMPTEEELSILRRIHAEQAAIYAADEKAAKKLVSIGDKESDPEIETAELAAWTAVGTVLLNLDATIHKR